MAGEMLTDGPEPSCARELPQRACVAHMQVRAFLLIAAVLAFPLQASSARIAESPPLPRYNSLEGADRRGSARRSPRRQVFSPAAAHGHRTTPERES
jgi:hypothetical protein